MESAHALDYASRESRPRRLWRWAWKVSLFLGVVAAGIFWGPGTYRWSEVLYWQHRFIGYTAPANHVVAKWNVAHPNQGQFAEINPAETHMRPNLNRSFAWATIFVAQMTLPNNGEKLLLSVDVAQPQPQSGGVAITDEISSPVEFLSRKQYPSVYADGECSIFLPPHASNIQVFAGQSDPVDPSHFTFDILCDQKRFTVDCWLNEHGMLTASIRP
jgi:hypothetical protein